jgi:hypothetical protein
MKCPNHLLNCSTSNAAASILTLRILPPKFCHLLQIRKMLRQFSRLDRQGCQIFLCTRYQNGKMYTYQIIINVSKWPQNIPYGRKTDQIVIKYTNIFHCKTLQNLPKLGFLVWKYAIWQPWWSSSLVKLLAHPQKVSDPNFDKSGNFENENVSMEKCLSSSQVSWFMYRQFSPELPGTDVWFLKYFRQKNLRKKWRFWLKTKLNYEKIWS